MSSTSSVILMALSLCASSGEAATPADLDTFAATPAASVVDITAETKMRKLHLVRPDLIPIPLTYNVYC